MEESWSVVNFLLLELGFLFILLLFGAEAIYYNSRLTVS